MSQTSEITSFILRIVDENPTSVTRLVSEKFKITRQSANFHVRRMLSDGLLRAEGDGRGRKLFKQRHTQTFPTRGTEEHRVFEAFIEPRCEGLAKNVEELLFYAVTEMVNNAIDHSEAKTFTISFARSDDFAEVLIEDQGVGAFKKIMRAFSLPDERQALLELHKGKATTAPDAHSGQGVFFTSRAMDEFRLASGRLVFTHGDMNTAKVADEDEVKGTQVWMRIRLDSKRQLVDIFDEFSIPEAGGFTKTLVPVRVAELEGRVLVSRSQAKRVLSRLDQFEEVVLDFRDVSLVGQAFADEIFRVYVLRQPKVSISAINMSESVKKMVHRAMADRARDEAGSQSGSGDD